MARRSEDAGPSRPGARTVDTLERGYGPEEHGMEITVCSKPSPERKQSWLALADDSGTLHGRSRQAKIARPSVRHGTAGLGSFVVPAEGCHPAAEAVQTGRLQTHYRE
jgi:hypothetical protein